MRIRGLVALLLLASPIWAQTVFRGNVHLSGNVTTESITPNVNFFAALPLSWVNSGLTTGTGFCSTTFDATKTMPGDYAATVAGLIQSKTDQAAAHQNWLLVITAGTTITGLTNDANNSVLSWPTTTFETGKCLTLRSSSHNTDGVTVCSTVYPSVRDANCTSSSSHFWSFVIQPTSTGLAGMYFPLGSNNIVIEDANISISPGMTQSQSGSNAIIQAQIDNASYIGFAYNWIHGWDLGDAGQPGAGSLNPAVDNATGVCLSWNRSGTLTADGSTTLTWASGDRFGMDFSDGSNSAGYPQVIAGQSNKLVIVGIGNRTITSHVPQSSDTQFVVNSPVAAGTYSFTLQNPKSNFATGCGDDSRGIQLNGDNVFFEYNQINKIHQFAAETHAVSMGFSNGPVKIAHNYIEAGSSGIFSLGGPVDQRGGPVTDVEIRGNMISRDPERRFLNCANADSPQPPFGCGPLDGVRTHNNQVMNWEVKNNLEMKGGRRWLIAGNIIENNWADAQTGWILSQGVRACSGGTACGIYDPATGLPLTFLDNVRWESNWVRNSPQVMEMSSRSLSPGNGGGMSQPVHSIDFINQLYTNIGDNAQWGDPGNDIIGTGGKGANTFPCTMSRTSNVAHAACSAILLGNLTGQFTSQPTLLDGAFDISSVTRVGNTATAKLNGLRHDPTVGQSVVIDAQDWLATSNFSNTKIKPSVGNPSGIVFSTGTNAGTIKTGSSAPTWSSCSPSCADGGITWTNTGTTSIGYEGTFAITGVKNGTSSTVCSLDNSGNSVPAAQATQPQPCIRANGTFGDTIIYSDSGNAGTCTSLSLCNQTGMRVILPTLAYKITDMSIGDDVYTHDCTDASYNVGATAPAVRAVSPTNPVGLDVYFPNSGANDNSGVTCQLENNSGVPSQLNIQNNTVLALKVMSSNAGGKFKQLLNNQFVHNLFTMPSGSGGVLTCASVGGQGTVAYVCWDQNTFQIFDNVMQGQTSTDWSVVPGGSTVNAFPANVTCAGATADPGCIGFSGYMSGTAFSQSACSYDGSNPNNCPYMAAPWSTNFDLSKISKVPSSSYGSEGADVSIIPTMINATEYVCPVGANCGTHGPYPD